MKFALNLDQINESIQAIKSIEDKTEADLAELENLEQTKYNLIKNDHVDREAEMLEQANKFFMKHPGIKTVQTIRKYIPTFIPPQPKK